MITTDRNTSSPTKVQCVNIDLPGETVQCWRSDENIQVILRKHRDIIFELKLAKGSKYTVESTGSDFYNANEKKLIVGKSLGSVSFDDGDRLHLWIARDFKGELLLKFQGKVMMKLEPMKFDARQYDEKPKTKPAPIVIALGSSSPNDQIQISKQSKLTESIGQHSYARPVAAPTSDDCALVCVVDGNIEGIPRDLWDLLKKGGGSSGWADLDPKNIATRNWLLAQVAGAGAYVIDNWEWLRASLDEKTHAGFKLVKAKIHYVRGKAWFYFSGYSKHNPVFRQGGFGSGHDRIMSIFGGAGDASAVMKSAAAGIAGTFKNAALVSFIFGSVSTLAEWKADVAKDGYDLAASLITNVIKSLVAAAITVMVVACIVFILMFVLEVSLSVVAVGIFTVGAGTVVGYGVDAADKKLGKMLVGESHQDGMSAVLAERMRQSIQYHWNYLKKKFSLDYEGSLL